MFIGFSGFKQAMKKKSQSSVMAMKKALEKSTAYMQVPGRGHNRQSHIRAGDSYEHGGLQTAMHLLQALPGKHT